MQRWWKKARADEEFTRVFCISFLEQTSKQGKQSNINLERRTTINEQLKKSLQTSECGLTSWKVRDFSGLTRVENCIDSTCGPSTWWLFGRVRTKFLAAKVGSVYRMDIIGWGSHSWRERERERDSMYSLGLRNIRIACWINFCFVSYFFHSLHLSPLLSVSCITFPPRHPRHPFSSLSSSPFVLSQLLRTTYSHNSPAKTLK